jgi:hypothetical protein
MLGLKAAEAGCDGVKTQAFKVILKKMLRSRRLCSWRGAPAADGSYRMCSIMCKKPKKLVFQCYCEGRSIFYILGPAVVSTVLHQNYPQKQYIHIHHMGSLVSCFPLVLE